MSPWGPKALFVHIKLNSMCKNVTQQQLQGAKAEKNFLNDIKQFAAGFFLPQNKLD